MGVESFQIVAETSAQIDRATEWLRTQGFFPDVEQPTPTTLELRDGRHVVEAEVERRDERTRISVRFALCHPPSVDDAVIAFALRLAGDLDAALRIVDDVPQGAPDAFEGSEVVTAFPRVIREAIDAKRRLWRNDFGVQEAAVTTRECLNRFLLSKPD